MKNEPATKQGIRIVSQPYADSLTENADLVVRDENRVIEIKSESSILIKDKSTFTIYNKKTDSLEVAGQGKAATTGNQYIETFEQSTSKNLLQQPLVFTYKVQGNKLSYEGGAKDFHIVEVLQRIE